MASDYTREWIQFFRGCGIPDDIAARYGLIFNENRIQKNMLLDLNKEYLRDMGITVMGDIIAILRHARIVYDKYMREQILSDTEEVIPIETMKIRKSTPMKRMLERYTRKNDPTKFSVPHEKVEICIENETATVNVPKKLAHRVGVQSKGSVKKRIEAPSMRSDTLPAGALEVSVPTVRRALPENEGNTIKMPSGTTERSKKLLEKVKLKQNKTVFDRLGESSVSSTSDVSTTSDGTVKISKVANKKEKNTLSVFSRLGEKSPQVTSTSSSVNTVKLPDHLPYKGILKTTAVKKRVQLPSSSTMRADNELNMSNANNAKLKKINLVKERLGPSLKTNQSSQLDGSVKLIRCQEVASLQGRTLLKSFKSLSTETEESIQEKKYVLDGLCRFRSETLKTNATSSTQYPNVQRGIKRRLDDAAEAPNSQTSDVMQTKKVRFGTTTHRLIPGNDVNPNRARIDFHRPAIVTEGYEKFEAKNVTLKSGLRIGPMNSDKARQIISLKDRIGPEFGKITIDLNRKRPVKFNSIIRKVPVTIHDRLG